MGIVVAVVDIGIVLDARAGRVVGQFGTQRDKGLGIALGIIEGDRSPFSTLIGAVIPHLSLSIESHERGASDAKCTIANTHPDP